MASTQAKNNTPCVQCRFSRHNITQRVISAALIVRLGRRRGHSRFSRGLQRAVCSLRGWKTRLLASIFFKSGNRTRGRGRMKNRPKNRKLPDFRISGKNLNSGKTVCYHCLNLMSNVRDIRNYVLFQINANCQLMHRSPIRKRCLERPILRLLWCQAYC